MVSLIANFGSKGSALNPPQIQRPWKVRIYARVARLDPAARMPERLEPGQSSPFGLMRVHRHGFEVAAAGVGDVVGAPADGAVGPAVGQVEDERAVGRDGGVQGRGWGPGAEADAGDIFAFDARRMKRQLPAVAGDGV